MFPEQLPCMGLFKEIAQGIRLSRADDAVFLTLANSYMDESFDPKHKGQYRGFFVVGGMMGRGWAVFELERRWQQLLEKHGLAYFKASECENGWRQFSKFVSDSKNITVRERDVLDSISLEFLALIVNPCVLDPVHYLTCYGVGILQEDFYEVIKSDYARSVLGDSPYRLAYDFAFIQGAWMMKQLGNGWGASFVCDEHEIHSPLAPTAYYKLKETNPEAAQYMLSFSSIDEKECAPVQAADAVVYEVRRALNFQSKQPELSGQLRKQFQFLAGEKGMGYIAHSNGEQLEWLVKNHKPGEPFKLDDLMKLQLGDNIDRIRI
jgi:hypothetical protein